MSPSEAEGQVGYCAVPRRISVRWSLTTRPPRSWRHERSLLDSKGMSLNALLVCFVLICCFFPFWAVTNTWYSMKGLKLSPDEIMHSDYPPEATIGGLMARYHQGACQEKARDSSTHPGLVCLEVAAHHELIVAGRRMSTVLLPDLLDQQDSTAGTLYLVVMCRQDATYGDLVAFLDQALRYGQQPDSPHVDLVLGRGARPYFGIHPEWPNTD